MGKIWILSLKSQLHHNTFVSLHDSVLSAGVADQYVNTNNGLNILGNFILKSNVLILI